MYRSELSHWNAFEMGPERDVVLCQEKVQIKRDQLLLFTVDFYSTTPAREIIALISRLS